MKKVQLLLTATLISIAVNAQNLLTNPDFEIWSGGVPTGWTLGTTGTVSQSAITSTGVGSAFQIAGPTSTYSLSQNVLPPNGAATFDTTSVYKITVTYLVKAGDGTDARIWSNLMTSTTAIYAPVTHNDSMLYYIPLHGPGGNISPIVPGNDMNGYLLDNRATGTWHTYSYSFKFRAGIAQLAFMVRSYSASTVIWDNLYFGKATMSDIQAPMPPTGLKNTPPVDNSFYLSWNAAVDNVGVTGYDVYKDSVYYGSTPALGLTITGLTPGATYKMTVKAKDAAGNISLASMPLLVSNSVPTGLAYYATVPSGTKACYIAGDMNGWIQQPMSRMDSTHYKIYIGSALPTHGYKYCSGPDWTYVEKDAAGGEIQNRGYSASDVVLSWLSVYIPTPDIIPPTIPTGLMATTPMTNTFTLSWTASTDNVSVMSYNVYKDSVFYGTTPSTSLIIIGLMPGTSCKMTVKAKDAAGNLSAASAPLIVTNQATTGVTYNVTVPAATLACYIAGEMNNWTQQPMNKVDNTHYRLIIPNALTAHAYKYCSGPDWAYVEKDNTGADIQNRVYTPADVVQAWASVYDPSVIPIAKDVTINVTVSDSVNVCYLVGTFNNWASPSDTTKMSRGIPANGKVVFSKTIYTTDANKLQFKFCAGPTWDYVQKVEVAFVYLPAESSVSVTVTSFWRIFDPTKTGTVRINATVPNGTKRVWIVGGFQGWDMVKAIEGTRNASGTFSFVLHGIMATEYRLYNKPDWASSEVGAANPTVDLPNRVASYPADSIANITVWGWKTAVDSVADTTAPSAPSGLKSTPPTTTEFFLSWAASTDNIGVTGYEVYKDSVFYGTTSNLGLNISGLTPGKIYKMTVRAKDAAGNLSAASTALMVTTLPDISTGITFKVKVPKGTYQCWIVGNFNSWNNNLNQMTRVDSTHYTITLYQLTFTPGITKDSLQYKYLSGGGDWAYVEKDSVGSEIQNRRYSTGVDIVGKWNVVYNPNVLPLPMDLTVSVTTPAGTNECYIVGSFNNWAGPTDLGCKMTKISTNPDGTIVFSISGHTEDANKFIYHFCSGPDWTFEQKTPVGDFKYPIVNPVVTEWKAVYDPSKVGTIKIKATVPAGTQNVWIQGSFLGWDMAKAISGTKNNDGTFSFTIPNILSMEYKLFNQPDWNYAETDSTGNIRANRMASYPVDSITNITVLGWKQTADTVSINNFTVKIDSGGIVNQNNMEVYDGAVLSVVKGTMLTFNIIPNIGYEVETVKLNGVDVKAQLVNNKFTTPAINGNVVLNVTFRKIMFSLAIRSAESGTLELFCEYGATPTFRFTPSTNWRINAVSYNNVDVTSYLANGIFTLPPVYSNATLNISFEYQTALYTPASSNVKIYSNNSEIIIDGIKSGEIIRLYSEDGAQLKVLKSQGNRMTISDMPNAIYLIKTETKTVKIIL